MPNDEENSKAKKGSFSSYKDFTNQTAISQHHPRGYNNIPSIIRVIIFMPFVPN